ncbi:Putative endoplasmic reticulum metallopeptidase 1-A [Eumeta japonica]|uniref:Endoplasmic reticulum metallopeptidase 1-A n=1 Tax=Eumeta variegata TaxID=151549 RepID=A0A4C1ZF61_EUMVA|nr:Putative endoplasmic reticulum metallopeptidase 1-A [Eumeta japonica]
MVITLLSNQKVPSYWLLVVLGTLLLLAFFTQLIEDDLPSVVSQDSIGRSEISLGERDLSSPKTKDLKELVDRVARDALQSVHTDWQFASGDFWLSYTAPHANSYYNVSNVAAMLVGESGMNGPALLVNCHYDSVPFALGTSDDAIFCAVMVETLSLLSNRNDKLKHNVIFLFNGAEENALQGSHAFLQHPWFRSVTTVINLDSAGMNGKSNLFQAVSKATQCRLWVKFSSSQGLYLLTPTSEYGGFWPSVDIAFVKWGNVYHTRYDSPKYLQAGTLQHAGDMLLSFVSAVGNDSEIGVKAEPTTAVYWDFLYVFMASYSFTVAYVIDVFILLFAILSVVHYLWTVGFRWLIVRELLHSVLGRIYSIVIGSLITMMLMWFMGMTTRQMRYLTNPWIVVPMYWIPYLITAVCTAHVCDKWREEKSGLNRIIRVAQAMCATRILVSLVVFVLICIPNTGTLRYVLTIPLLLMSKNAMLTLTLIRLFRLKGEFYYSNYKLKLISQKDRQMYRFPHYDLCISLASLTSINLVKQESGINAVEMRSLRSMCGVSQKDRCRNRDVREWKFEAGCSDSLVTTATYLFLFLERAWHHLLIEYALAIIPTLFLISLALRINALILPTMGRSMNNNPDYSVGQINLILAIVVPMALSGIELSFSRRFLWICSLALGLVTLVLMLWPFRVYSDSGPATQRHYWFHTEIVSYNYGGAIIERQHGVLVTKHDAYTPDSVLPVLEENKLNYRYRTNFSADCEQYVYCNLPLYRTRFGEYLGSSILLFTGAPNPFSPPPGVSLRSKSCVGITCTYHISMTGPAHNMLTIWPRQDVNLTSWSLSAAPRPTLTHAGRPVYVLIHNTATYSGQFVPLNVTLNFVIPEHLQSQPVVDVSHHAHKLQDPQDNTAEFDSLVNAMPDYFNIATTITIRSNYVF